jgi:hypothetical protein
MLVSFNHAGTKRSKAATGHALSGSFGIINLLALCGVSRVAFGSTFYASRIRHQLEIFLASADPLCRLDMVMFLVYAFDLVVGLFVTTYILWLKMSDKQHWTLSAIAVGLYFAIWFGLEILFFLLLNS